ncbi:MAG: CPBP family intramembrane metalloprotease [Maribacter sp.]|nr:CPBP family intramembrane metalloprotease [Maribacter sp.]
MYPNILACFFFSFIIFIYAAIEEWIFRKFLYDRFGGNFRAAIITSLLFSAAHMFNTEIYPIALINTFLIGFLLVIVRNISGFWECIKLHFIWNWVIAVLFSDILSGIDFSQFGESKSVFSNSIFNFNYSRNILNGGQYGIENSPILLLVIALVFFVSLKNKDKLFSP